MYHPYFRGKLFELMAIRETAKVMAKADFVPIIEPVKGTLTGLDRTLKAVCEADGQAIVIVNPHHGDLAEDGVTISSLLEKDFLDKNGVTAGILLKESTSLAAASACYEKHKAHAPTFIHAGFSDGKALAEMLGKTLNDTRHVFFERYGGKLYRKHFKGAYRALLRDGFEKRRNVDHQKVPVERFSDLHVTFEEEDMNGFGDFLIVGDDYSEGGGPAYAVAIHLTFINTDDDDVMYIYHFVSNSNDTPTDPGGKFAQALEKLITRLDSGNSMLFESSAIEEFRALHVSGHFPGLGSVKKLSMRHHIETLASFFA